MRDSSERTEAERAEETGEDEDAHAEGDDDDDDGDDDDDDDDDDKEVVDEEDEGVADEDDASETGAVGRTESAKRSVWRSVGLSACCTRISKCARRCRSCVTVQTLIRGGR
jgi:hypothetical protein